MTGQTIAHLLWGVGALVLVGSSLLARRLRWGQAAKMALAWIGIFGFAYVLVLFRGEGAAIWHRITADITGDRGTVVAGALRIPQADDGHYWVVVTLNGHNCRFLVDSGATVTTISPQTAQLAGIAPDFGPALMTQTANGTAQVRPARAETLIVGPITRHDERVWISTVDGENLLGMSFLSQLQSWRVERGTLTLQQRSGLT